MPRLVLQLAILLRGALHGCSLLLTLAMGGTSSSDLLIAPLAPGVLRLVLQLASLSGCILTLSCLLHISLMGSTSFLGLMMT